MQNSWKTNNYFDHHDIFNFVSYIIIGFTMQGIMMDHSRNKYLVK